MMNMSEYAIRAKNIKKHYGSVEVIRGVSLAIENSRFTAIVGKSGSGKSTMLGIISGLEKPDAGSIDILGTDLFALGSDEMARVRRDTLGIVFQSFNLVPSLTAIENVLLPVVFAENTSAGDMQKRAESLLEQVGISNRAHHRPGALSGGEQQRVAIARALINQPAIILADEPTGNLDENTAGEIIDLLTGLSRDMGTTLLMVTHDMDIAGKADRIIVLKDGRIENDKS